MRIVAGRFKGKQLATPKGWDIRPTSDKTREAIFNILTHGIEGFRLEGALVLDLFSGTGALGLEALSRGAAYCLFVEENAEARALIRRNIEALGVAGETRIFRRDATGLGQAARFGGRFDVLFADPPYGRGLAELALRSAAQGRWLKPEALCVVEEEAEAELAPPPGFELLQRRDYGAAAVHFLRWEG
jgi:16S rRNA (guanine966-N2)-methyltransferase